MLLEERVRLLERRCRSLTALALLLPAAVGIGVLAGANREADEKVVRARALEIVDDAGRVRVRVGTADEGYGVVINDARGDFRATMTDAPLGAAIQLKKGGGQVKLLAAEPVEGVNEGEVSIAISDARGQSRIVGAVDAKGKPSLQMVDQGKVVFSAPGPGPAEK